MRWEENNQAPRGTYRFVDATGKGWQSDGKAPFVASNWQEELEKAKALAGKPVNKWWFDAEAARWSRQPVPSTHRLAMGTERPTLTKAHGYSPEDAPVYVKAKFRPKGSSGPSKPGRPPDLRALDRTARVLYGALAPESSPHLAAAVVGGELNIAGNTGTRRVTGEEQAEADERLTLALDPTKGEGTGRSAKDARKLRALASGDYQAHHAGFAGSLGDTAEALKLPARWSNVGVSGGGSKHGELTVLGRLLVDLQNTPRLVIQPPTVVPLGGVKLACKACNWALIAFNTHLANPLGYQVKVSGTHGGLFPGWKAPDYLWNHPQAKSELEGKPTGGWFFTSDGELRPPGRSIVPPYKDQDPEDSDSDWEEID